MKTRAEIAAIIDAAIAAAPCPIRPGAWGVKLVNELTSPHWEPAEPYPCCCPLGALLLQIKPFFDGNGAKSGWVILKSIGQVLGVSPEWINGFINGFDGRWVGSRAENSPDWNDGESLGHEFRDKLLPLSD